MKKVVLIALSVLCFGFDLIEMPTKKDVQPRVLIIGGIQGDEPGGFNAANLFLQYYRILQGEVLVIPNLNRASILRNHRGIYGDMNRKFQALDPNDAEFDLIQRLKTIILQDRIDFIYHLHDGGGFYRETYIDRDFNPNRWGNCSIIDQEKLDGVTHGNLLEIAGEIVKNINAQALKQYHFYRVRNTQTKTGDQEMEKSLTFFAIRNQKAAMANEASKNLPVHERVYYHFLGIEGMLKAVGVKFERDFELNPKNIYALINDARAYVKINHLIKIPVFGLRKKLNFFPLPKNIAPEDVPLQSNHYIMGLLKKQDGILLKYGNRLMTTLAPLYLEFSSRPPQKVWFEIDGEKMDIELGSIARVKKTFKILKEENAVWRANVIGFYGKGMNEVGEDIVLKKMNPKYSIDLKAKQYRVEFYEKEKFLGMVIVHFS